MTQYCVSIRQEDCNTRTQRQDSRGDRNMDERKKEKDKIDSCCSKNKLISRTAKKSRGLCRILVRNNQRRTQQISWGYIKRVLDSGNYSNLNQLIIPYQYPEGEILDKKIYKKDDGHNSIINHDITHYLWHDFKF